MADLTTTVEVTKAAVEATRILGETLGFWAQTAAFFFSAVGAVGVIYHNGVVARKRATIDHIIHQKSDKDYLAAIHCVYELHEQKTPLVSYCAKQEGNSDMEKHRSCILAVLNNHEFIALGIRKKAFDEKIYKDLQYSNFLKVWDSCQGFIAELRRTRAKDTLFQEFEWLATRWKNNPLKVKK